MNASDRITKHIDDLADWRGRVMAQLRKLIALKEIVRAAVTLNDGKRKKKS